MQYTNNCPAVPDYFNPNQPVWHSEPVHHPMTRAQDLPAACLWAQLQWERRRNDGGPQYLETLETEWQRRDLCSECLRKNDHPFMIEIDDLQRRARQAEEKLAAIDGATRLPDQSFRLTVLSVLNSGPADPST